mgnify:CR=1 FL=1
MASMHLRNEEERNAVLDVMWQHSLTGCALVGPDNKFVAANPAFCQITEYTEFELQGLTFDQITIPEDQVADLAMFERVRAGQIDSYDMVKHYITKQRHVVRVVLRVVAVRLADGTFERFYSQISPAQQVVVPTDKTGYKSAHMAVRWWSSNWMMVVGWGSAIGAGLASLGAALGWIAKE